MASIGVSIIEDIPDIGHGLERIIVGANGYLLKQSLPDRILEALRELHEGGAPMSTGIARRVVASLRSKTSQPTIEILSPRENEILRLLAKGLLYKEIGIRLQISTGTVRQHIHKIYSKLQVQNKTEAINKAFGK